MIVIAIQGFHTLTELCQGPCPGNQAALVSSNVSGAVNRVLQLEFADRCRAPCLCAFCMFVNGEAAGTHDQRESNGTPGFVTPLQMPFGMDCRVFRRQSPWF